MYALRNNSDVVTRIWLVTFANGASDVRVRDCPRDWLLPVWLGIPHPVTSRRIACRSSCRVPIIYYCQILAKIGTSRYILVILGYCKPNFVKINSVVLRLLHADKQTDVAKLITAILQLRVENASKKRIQLTSSMWTGLNCLWGYGPMTGHWARWLTGNFLTR
jgi:hypothetical protein